MPVRNKNFNSYKSNADKLLERFNRSNENTKSQDTEKNKYEQIYNLRDLNKNKAKKD